MKTNTSSDLQWRLVNQIHVFPFKSVRQQASTNFTVKFFSVTSCRLESRSSAQAARSGKAEKWSLQFLQRPPFCCRPNFWTVSVVCKYNFLMRFQIVFFCFVAESISLPWQNEIKNRFRIAWMARKTNSLHNHLHSNYKVFHSIQRWFEGIKMFTKAELRREETAKWSFLFDAWKDFLLRAFKKNLADAFSHRLLIELGRRGEKDACAGLVCFAYIY